MFSEFQKTLSEPVKFEGVGLHSGKIKNNIFLHQIMKALCLKEQM